MYKNKYIKYKKKYVDLKNKKMIGGALDKSVKPGSPWIAPLEVVTYPKFDKGDKFIHIYNKKTGTIRSLRDGSYEKKERAKDPSHYYYHVDFDDGTFETYMHQQYMKLVNSDIPKKPPPSVDTHPIKKNQNKFKVGDMVKRIGSSWNDGGSVNPEAMGLVGEIMFISESVDNIIPKLYVINFPYLYKGTKHEGVLLSVPEKDLILFPLRNSSPINSSPINSSPINSSPINLLHTNEVNTVLPKLGHGCWKEIVNAKSNEEYGRLAPKYKITTYKSYTTKKEIGSVVRTTDVFCSQNYPSFMFMETKDIDMRTGYTKNISLAYRDFVNINICDNFPNPGKGTQAEEVFNDGLSGECTGNNNKYNFKPSNPKVSNNIFSFDMSPTNSLPSNLSPTNILQNNYLQLPNQDSLFVNKFRPKTRNYPDGFIPDYSNNMYNNPSEDSDNIDWNKYHQEINKDLDDTTIKKPSKKPKKKPSKKPKKKPKKKPSKKPKKKPSKKSNK